MNSLIGLLNNIVLLYRFYCNKQGVSAEFCPPIEKLAFSIATQGEVDFPEIWAEPLPVIIDLLTKSESYQEVANNLPDIEP